MPFVPATPDPQPTYEAMLFDGSKAHAIEVVEVIDAALAIGDLLLYGHAEGFREEGNAPPVWRIRMKRLGDADEVIVVSGMWVTVSSYGAVRGLTDAEYQAGVR